MSVTIDGTNGITAPKVTFPDLSSQGSAAMGRNKIINANFEYPVNQLAKASRVTTAGAYNFDQWYYGTDSKFYQPLEFINLSANQVYTLNWSGTATAEYKFATVGSSGIVADAGAWTAITKGAQLTAPADVITGSKFLWLRWTGVTAALATFDKPQLEEGTVATTFERKLYDQVLRECQRYLPVISSNSGYFTGQAQASTSVSANFMFQVAARVAPTGYVLSSYAGVVALNVGGSAVAVTNFAAYGYSTSQAGLSATTSGMTAGNASMISLGANLMYFTGAQI